MSTQLIVRYCAPTLAGLKIGNIFSFKFSDHQSLSDSIYYLNELLNPKGVYVTVLKLNKETALIYVYRKERLEQLLKTSRIKTFLSSYGYEDTSLTEALSKLSYHLKSDDFPHEIGIFLGYPLEDIIAFIENKGKDYKCVGCWKVYHDEASALKTFAKYDKCTKVYCKKAGEGCCINRLTVAS